MKTEVERNYALKVVCSGELVSVVVRLKNGWTREGERKRDVGDGKAFILLSRGRLHHTQLAAGGGVGVEFGWLVGCWGKEKRDRNRCFFYLFFYFLFFIFFSQIHSLTELGSHLDGLGLTYKRNDTIGSIHAERVWVAFRLRNSVRIVGAISWKGDGELLQITGAGEG